MLRVSALRKSFWSPNLWRRRFVFGLNFLPAPLGSRAVSAGNKPVANAGAASGWAAAGNDSSLPAGTRTKSWHDATHRPGGCGHRTRAVGRPGEVGCANPLLDQP